MNIGTEVKEQKHPRNTWQHYIEPDVDRFAESNAFIANFLGRSENAMIHKGHLRVWMCTEDEAAKLERSARREGFMLRRYKSYNKGELRRIHQPEKYTGKFRTENKRGGHRR